MESEERYADRQNHVDKLHVMRSAECVHKVVERTDKEIAIFEKAQHE